MSFDFSIIQEYFTVVAMLGCLVIGYVLKKWVEDVDNKLIPTILPISGAILTCIANGGITLENIVFGAVGGLASTGLHQAFTKYIERKEG